MYRKILAIFLGLIIVCASYWFSYERPWLYYAGLAISGIFIGIIVNNKRWIPGIIVGLMMALWLLFEIAWIIGESYSWRPGIEYYIDIIYAILCPPIIAEITGKSIAYIKNKNT